MSSHDENDENMDYRPIPSKHHAFKTPFKEGHPRHPTSHACASVSDGSDAQCDSNNGYRHERLFRIPSSSPSIKSEPNFFKRKAAHPLTSSNHLRSTPPYAAPFSSSPACSSPSYAMSKKAKGTWPEPVDSGSAHFTSTRSPKLPSRVPIGELAKSAAGKAVEHLRRALNSQGEFTDQAVLEELHTSSDFVVDIFTRKMLIKEEETKKQLEKLGSLLLAFVIGIEEVTEGDKKELVRQREEASTFLYRAHLLFHMSRPKDDASMGHLSCVRRFIISASLAAFKLAAKHKDWAAQLIDMIAVDVNSMKGNLDTHDGREALCAYFLARHRLACHDDNQQLAKTFLRKTIEYAHALPSRSTLFEQIIRTTINAASAMLEEAEANESDDKEECNSSVGSVDGGAADERILCKSIADLRRANKLLSDLTKLIEGLPRSSSTHLQNQLRDKELLRSQVLNQLSVSTDNLTWRLESEHCLSRFGALSVAAGEQEDAVHATLLLITSMEVREADLSSIEVHWTALFERNDNITTKQLDTIIEILSRTSTRSEQIRDGVAGNILVGYLVRVSTSVVHILRRMTDRASTVFSSCITKVGYLILEQADASEVDAIAGLFQLLGGDEYSLGVGAAHVWLSIIERKAKAVIDNDPMSAFKLLSLAASPIFGEDQATATEMAKLAALTAIDAGVSKTDTALTEAIAMQPEDVQSFMHCYYYVKQKDEEEALRALRELEGSPHSVSRDALVPLISEAKSSGMHDLASLYCDIVWTTAEQECTLASLEMLRDYVSLHCKLATADRSICRDGGQRTCEMMERCTRIIDQTLQSEGRQEEEMKMIVEWFVCKISDLANDESLRWSEESKWALGVSIISIVEACREHGLLVAPEVFDLQLSAGLQHIDICRDFAEASPSDDAEQWANLYHCVDTCETYLTQARSKRGFLDDYDVIEAVLNDVRLTALLQVQEWDAVVKVCGDMEKPLGDACFQKVLAFVFKSKDAPSPVFRHLVELFLTKHHAAIHETKKYDAPQISPWIVQVANRLDVELLKRQPEEYKMTLFFLQAIIDSFLHDNDLEAQPAWPESDLSTLRIQAARQAKDLIESELEADFKCDAAVLLLECGIAFSNASLSRGVEEKQRYERWLREEQAKAKQRLQGHQVKQESVDHTHPSHTSSA